MTWTSRRKSNKPPTRVGKPTQEVGNHQGPKGSKARAETPQIYTPATTEADIKAFRERKRPTIEKIKRTLRRAPTCPTWAVAAATFIITFSIMLGTAGGQSWQRESNTAGTRQSQRTALQPTIEDSDGKVIFTTIGHTVSTRRYYQWRYTYDLHGLTDSIQQTSQAMHDWANAIGAPQFKRYNTTQWLGDEHHNVQTDLQIAAFHQLNRIGRSLSKFTDITKTPEQLRDEYYEDHPNKRFEINNRNKRFVFLAIAKTVLAVTMTTYYAVSIYNELNGNQVQAQLDIIKQAANDSAFLHELEAQSMDTLAAMVKEIAEDLNAHRYFEHAHIKIKAVLDEFERLVSTIIRDFEAVKDGNCPVTMFVNTDLGEIVHDIEKATAGTDWEALMTRATDLTQIDCTFAINQDEFHIIARLPIISPKTTQEIMRLVPFPILMDSGKLMLPSAGEKTHLLVTKDGEFFAERSTADISQCKRRGNLFSCERNNLMRRVTDDTAEKSCLVALYTNRFEAAARSCQFELRQPEPILEQINHNTFLAYTPKPQKATIICQGHSYVATLHDVDLITLTEGCTIRTNDFMVTQDETIHRTTEDALPIQQVDWPKALNFLKKEFSEEERELLSETSRDSKDARNTIFRHDVQQSIDDIQATNTEIRKRANATREALDALKAPTSHSWTKWGLVAGVVGVAIIALLAIALYCTLQATKVSFKDLPAIIIREGAKHFGIPTPMQPQMVNQAPARPAYASQITSITEVPNTTALVPTTSNSISPYRAPHNGVIMTR